MFGIGKRANKPQNRIDTLIGAGTKIRGDVSFTGGLRIDGEVYGNVVAANNEPSTLVISEHARVEGEISVTHLVVNGTATGPVHCRDFLELQPRARITGDVRYNSIEIQLGAVIHGRLVHEGVPAKPVELKLASTTQSA